jgi:hypothetical protein
VKPFPTTPLKLRVTDVKADASGVAKVIWSRGSGLSPLGTGTASGFPSSLLAAGDSVIMAEVQYTYTSPIHKLLPNALTFKETYYLRPRRSAEVVWVAG